VSLQKYSIAIEAKKIDYRSGNSENQLLCVLDELVD